MLFSELRGEPIYIILSAEEHTEVKQDCEVYCVYTHLNLHGTQLWKAAWRWPEAIAVLIPMCRSEHIDHEYHSV